MRYQTIFPCNFLNWNRFDVLALEPHHQSVAVPADQLDGLIAETRRQQTIIGGGNSPAQEMPQYGHARFHIDQGFDLSGEYIGDSAEPDLVGAGLHLLLHNHFAPNGFCAFADHDNAEALATPISFLDFVADNI